MQYRVRHTTRYEYDAPVSENVMEVRLCPRSDNTQNRQSFTLTTDPRTRPISFVDYLGNTVHTFDVPIRHQELSFLAESVVTVLANPEREADQMVEAWSEIDAAAASPTFWEMSKPTQRTSDTGLLAGLAKELDVSRHLDPYHAVESISRRLHETLTYDSNVTHVHSDIDESLAIRSGVCQDFTHIMLALLRNYLHIPCRYVSGYLYHSTSDTSVDGASHAWLEAYMPRHGWVGFDPTNDMRAGERHILVAYGRDYGDVAPARGVFTGKADSHLSVNVSVQKVTDAPPVTEEKGWRTKRRQSSSVANARSSVDGILSQRQQQQQQ